MSIFPYAVQYILVAYLFYTLVSSFLPLSCPSPFPSSQWDHMACSLCDQGIFCLRRNAIVLKRQFGNHCSKWLFSRWCLPCKHIHTHVHKIRNISNQNDFKSGIVVWHEQRKYFSYPNLNMAILLYSMTKTIYFGSLGLYCLVLKWEWSLHYKVIS